MYLLSRAYLQLLAGLYRSMTPGSRLTAGSLATVVTLSLGYLVMHQGSSPEVDLMHGLPLSAAQLPAMEAALAKASLKGYEIRGTAIFVPRGQEADYMAALAGAGALPRPFGDSQHQAVNGSTMFEFGTQHDQRMRIAKQDELARGICDMPGIESAYVLYDVDSKPGPFQPKVITAAVMVKPAAAGRLDQELVKGIRGMVAHSIAGLKPENVAVTDLATGRTWYGDPEGDAGSGDSLYNSLKRTYEQDLKNKMLGALGFIPNVIVEVSVEPDHQRFIRTKQDERSLAADQVGSRNAANAGAKDDRPGRSAISTPQSNTATILGNLLGGARSQDEGTEAKAAAPVSRMQVEKESVGLTPEAAKVSVGVPISYFKKVWQERNLAEPGHCQKSPDAAALERIRLEESAKIQRHVAQLLPSIESASKAAELVTVTAFQDIPIAEPPAPEFRQELLSWLRQSWRMLSTIALALIGLLVLWSMGRTQRSRAEAELTAASNSFSSGVHAPFSPGVHAGDELDGLEDPSYDQAAAIPPPHARGFYGARTHNAAAASRDELSELVEDDPEAAANVLRSWIGKVE